MAMEHKAYAFDWNRFAAELLSILLHALETQEKSPLEDFIDKHRTEMTDPYEGRLLPEQWRGSIETDDLLSIADVALTRYYRPAEDHGIGGSWMEISESLPAAAATALLGECLGPPHAQFDPGRMGSYFQKPDSVLNSLQVLNGINYRDLQAYRKLLERCGRSELGVYVTF
jgi:hypothetical protein